MKRGSLSIDGGGAGAGPAVVFASQGEAEAGANNTKVMSPLRTAQAIAALGGGGVAPLDRVRFVDGNHGSNSTGDGSMTNPYQSLQVAYYSVGGSDNATFVVRGAVGDIAGLSRSITLIGFGREESSVGQITGTTTELHIRGNGRDMISVANIELVASAGAGGANGPNETDGEVGGPAENAGETRVSGLFVGGVVTQRGGVGGAGGTGGSGLYNRAANGGTGGMGGSAGSLYVDDCTIVGDVESVGGDGGPGGGGRPGGKRRFELLRWRWRNRRPGRQWGERVGQPFQNRLNFDSPWCRGAWRSSGQRWRGVWF